MTFQDFKLLIWKVQSEILTDQISFFSEILGIYVYPLLKYLIFLYVLDSFHFDMERKLYIDIRPYTFTDIWHYLIKVYKKPYLCFKVALVLLGLYTALYFVNFIFISIILYIGEAVEHYQISHIIFLPDDSIINKDIPVFEIFIHFLHINVIIDGVDLFELIGYYIVLYLYFYLILLPFFLITASYIDLFITNVKKFKRDR